MSTDYSDLFAAAGADADRGVLAPPEVLRHRGDIRSRRQVLTVVSLAVAVLAILAGSGLALATGHAAPMQPAGPTSVANVPTGAATPPSTPPPSTAPSHVAPTVTTTTPKSTACAGADLTFVSVLDDGAMGTAGHTFTVRNRSDATCTLRGYPVLTYRSSDGVSTVVPTTPNGESTTISVRPGRDAQFAVHHLNGYSGYPPTDPHCANPMLYEHLAVSFPDGSSVPLGTESLDVKCGVVTIEAWIAP